MQHTSQSWSIVIFCYNEEGTLRSVIESVEQFFETIQCTNNEIVIVYDGSADNCREIVRKAAETFPNIKPIYHSRNLGIGCALRSGYASVQYENVSAVPGDWTVQRGLTHSLRRFTRKDIRLFLTGRRTKFIPAGEISSRLSTEA